MFASHVMSWSIIDTWSNISFFWSWQADINVCNCSYKLRNENGRESVQQKLSTMKNCIRRFDSFLNSRTKKWSHQICFSERLKVLRMNMRLPLLVLFCVTSSQGIDYNALVPCNDNQGVMCDGDCLPAHWWCHDHPSLTDYHCMDSGVMTDDTN